MKTACLVGILGAALLVTGCTAQVVSPTSVPASAPVDESKTQPPGPSLSVRTPTPGTVVASGPFAQGSAVCNDSLTDSNPLNIATATLSSDGKTLSVLITLDSPNPIKTGRAFTVTLGKVQHQTAYTISIDETETGAATAEVTDAEDGHVTQVPNAQASISDERVSAQVPAADFPRLADHFLWKVEASANGTGYDICPNENSSGVRVWLDFPGRQ